MPKFDLSYIFYLYTKMFEIGLPPIQKWPKFAHPYKKMAKFDPPIQKMPKFDPHIQLFFYPPIQDV